MAAGKSKDGYGKVNHEVPSSAAASVRPPVRPPAAGRGLAFRPFALPPSRCPMPLRTGRGGPDLGRSCASTISHNALRASLRRRSLRVRTG
jgi:hypothetical protein